MSNDKIAFEIVSKQGDLGFDLVNFMFLDIYFKCHVIGKI